MIKEKAFNFLSFLMFFLIILLIIGTFNSNFYFEFDKSKMAYFFTNTLNFKNIFSKYEDDNLVALETKYKKVNDLYYSESNQIYALDDGVVIEANYNNIQIYQNNKFYLQYKGDFDGIVKKGDYVEKGTTLAFNYEGFIIKILDKKNEYSYEEYFNITI